KARHPAAFFVALLNAWPMGFYHPATLIKDAERHGVKVFPIDVNKSKWRCTWENGGIRMGLRYVKGLRESGGLRVEREQPFTSADDLAYRCQLRDDQLTKLAYAGALGSLGLTRRAALWQASQAAKPAGDLFEQKPAARRKSPLREMSRAEETMADYTAMELTTGPHLLEHFRPQLERDGVLTAAELRNVPNGSRVATAGAVIVRQRPGTAKGFVFLTLEDETGLSQAIVHPDLFRDERATILSNSGLIVEGIVQNQEGQASVRAEKFWPLVGINDVYSHDFH
ncbi:MAG TPA: OB-fold nucleic acid binding domain-containing protein, partial [Thermoanaerobaculia bacterium]